MWGSRIPRGLVEAGLSGFRLTLPKPRSGLDLSAVLVSLLPILSAPPTFFGVSVRRSYLHTCEVRSRFSTYWSSDGRGGRNRVHSSDPACSKLLDKVLKQAHPKVEGTVPHFSHRFLTYDSLQPSHFHGKPVRSLFS